MAGGNLEESEQEHKIVLDSEQNNAEARFGLWMVYYARGRLNTTVREYKKGLKVRQTTLCNNSLWGQYTKTREGRMKW
jgi:hypothetical protein